METKHLFVLWPQELQCISAILQTNYKKKLSIKKEKITETHFPFHLMLFYCIPKSIKFDYFDAHRWAEAQPWKLCVHTSAIVLSRPWREDKYDIREIINS